MPGTLLSTGANRLDAVAGMKRAHAAVDSGATGNNIQAKKRKVLHHLQYRQSQQHVADPVSAEFDPFGESRDFHEHQLRRAIAIQCKSIGFDSARPEALEEMTSLATSYMTNFLAQVRKSMLSSRRTDTVAFDWIYALTSTGLRGSGVLDQHFDTGEIPPELLQPPIEPATELEQPPPSLEPLLGSSLSGKEDKDTRPYIPKHFPAFPSKHAYKSTAVFTKRENDPRKIREKATEEGIQAEQSLRRLMAAQKEGKEKRQKMKKMKETPRMIRSKKLWREALDDLLQDEDTREKEEEKQQQKEQEERDAMNDWDAPPIAPARRNMERVVDLEQGVQVNWDQKYWRRAYRGV